MENKQTSIMQDLIIKKDIKIAELIALINKNVECHRHALQEKAVYYENILALMPGSVYWLDRNNVYMGCNDNQARQVLLPSRHDIVGKRTCDLLSNPDEAIEVDKLNSLVMETGIAHSDIERGVMSDGERVYFSQKVPLRNKNNEVIGLLGISIDITELKKTEEALTIARDHAEAANRAKTQFIANMSHDIRTPLSGVIGMSSLLKDRLTHVEHKQFAHWINQSGEQLLNLLNSILDVVSAENMSDCDIRDEVFDLRQCMDDIVQLERPTTLLKGIELNVVIDPLVPQHVLTDRAKLHRVLLNLLGNAIKFTQVGSIQIEINLLNSESAQTFLQFKVIDSGIGIALEQQDKVFERFFRSSSSYDGIYSGYGVGLHIAQSYVKLLGGELKLTSQLGTGTTFYFDVPIGVTNVTPPASMQENVLALNHPHASKNRDGGYHILIVEDNAIALRMVELIAAQAGCTYSSAINGEDAYELVNSLNIDLIITDIGLPLISGYELTRRIRAREVALNIPPVPIVGLTAHAHAKNECIKSGMNDVFCKPINLSMLESILALYVDSSQTECKPSMNRHGLPDLDAQLFELDEFPILDIEHAAHRIGNKSVLLEMLYLMATQEIPIDEACLQEAHATGDWEAIEKLAHKMKGGAVYCGTFKMQYACQYLERYRKSGQTELLEELYQQLLQILEETKRAIVSI